MVLFWHGALVSLLLYNTPARFSSSSVVAPSLVKNGLAVGIPVSTEYPLVSYLSLSFDDPEAFIANPSPRYWLLWPGILIMLLYSFTEVMLSLGPLLLCKRNPFECLVSTD